jgi:hypothetical protein
MLITNNHNAIRNALDYDGIAIDHGKLVQVGQTRSCRSFNPFMAALLLMKHYSWPNMNI